MSTNEDRWLSAAEIAEYLGITKDTAYKWIERREMPAHRVGRAWKFKKNEVDTWVTQGKAGDQS